MLVKLLSPPPPPPGRAFSVLETRLLDLWGKNTGEDGKGERERRKERGGQESEDGGAGRKHSLARARAALWVVWPAVRVLILVIGLLCTRQQVRRTGLTVVTLQGTYGSECSAVACVAVRTAARVTSSLVNVTVHPGSEVNYVKTDVPQVH